MRIGSLFSGYSGLEMGVQSVLGGTVAWHSEIDPGACKILAHRYPDVPNLGDITVVDWSAVEPVDVLTGGSPCQDLSHAGRRGGMTAGTRSNLWVSMREAIAQLRPSLVVWENVRGAYSAPADSELESREGRVGGRGDGPVLRALGRVLGDLSELGFDAEWVGLRASDVGAPHARFRVFLAAWPAADARSEAVVKWAGLRPDATREVGWSRPDHGDRVAPDSDDAGLEGHRRLRSEAREGETSAHDPGTSPDSDGDGLEGVGRFQSFGRDANGRDRENRVRHQDEPAAWGQYGDAVRRWERLTRPAPYPTEPGSRGGRNLSPAFVEWMMGLPAGWVTDVPGLTRNEQLKALGNGVVPQQAAAALRLLLPDVGEVAA